MKKCNFQYTYVWNYSSTQLPLHLLISSFYAGQEGSFLLWSLLMAIIGAALIPYAKKNGYESIAMGFYSMILVFILLLLIIKSPFNQIWDSFDSVAKGFTPPNGRGLNPILENFWITIHPPILFLGYAATSVPFIFAISGFIKKDYNKWIEIAMPWTLFASGMLGLGIALGAFWSYETLGWGGFWGWDPVENSSLIPWLITIALIHSMLIQKRTSGYIKTTFFLAVLSFVFVLYATFLTRSGVLGDTSVHSFVDPGNLVYAVLLIFIFVFLLIGLFILFLRLKDIDKKKFDFSLASRESNVALGTLLLLTSTALVFIGTSFPIFLEILGQPKTAIEISFYNIWNLPVAVAFMLICGLSLFFNWRNVKYKGELKKSIISASIAILFTIILIISGVSEIKYILLSATSFYCLLVNLQFLIMILKSNPKLSGSHISHIGVAIFFLGVIASGGFSYSSSLMLQKGDSAELFGKTFTFVGKHQIDKKRTDMEKYEYLIKVESDGNFQILHPIVYLSDFNNRESPFFEPDIDEDLTKDFYISPKSISYNNDIPSVFLSKMSAQTLPYDSTYKVALINFDMSGVEEARSNNSFKLGAVLSVEHNGITQIDTVYSYMDMTTGEVKPDWIQLDSSNLLIGFTHFKLNKQVLANSEIVLSVKKIGKKYSGRTEIFMFEVSIKPFMNLVWFGIIFMIAGFFIAITRYWSKKK